MLTTEQVLEKLRAAGVTQSKQMLLRWVREGHLTATKQSNKSGYLYATDEVLRFIREKKGVKTPNPLLTIAKQWKERGETQNDPYKRGYYLGVSQGLLTAAETMKRTNYATGSGPYDLFT